MVGFNFAVISSALFGLVFAVPQNIQSHSGSWKNKIKNVVVLVQENRSFDTFAGGLDYAKMDGLVRHNYCNSMNSSDPAQHDDVCAGPRANDVAPDDPNHSIAGINMQVYSTWHPDSASKPNMRGFVTEQSISFKTLNKTRAAEAINYHLPSQIPVFASLAENYVLFDRWFASVPGPTNPNRAYLTSGTSAGHGSNDQAFDIYGLPQKSIFEQLSEKGISWMNYQNSTLGPGQGFNPDAAFYTWTNTSRTKDTNIAPLTKFYEDAKNGDLPQFTWINPECCSYQSYHPPSPISMGELFIKDIYEALRASPQWDSTLFVLTFDEHGGFGDHVAPPMNVPAGDDITYTEKAPDGQNYTFDFTRLGVRVPTLVISPWVKGGVIETKGRNNGGVYSHTSLLKTVNELWGLDDLTERVGWSSSFEHLIQDTKRVNTPKDLPDPTTW
ncbi:hypothetical protein HYFRA_00001717 [Hymenoscyphus fraxineus]|uniref:Phosphoesterase n=1 Tax=Hymenoscyphus fraxineus TaxID=746836 RepID=A0A9N9PMM5_9HELO|nr:hypothetical protein HYFRA_00001717 [Hymenoscyphus fraxineus]